MKNCILFILSLFQLTISVAAFDFNDGDELIEIKDVNDGEIIYQVNDGEQSQLWRWDIKTSAGIPLTSAKPYLKDNIISYKKIDGLEVFTKEHEKPSRRGCELWIVYEGHSILVTDEALCDTKNVVLNNSRLYIPLESGEYLGFPGGYINEIALISYDLNSNKTRVEFDRSKLDTYIDQLDAYLSVMDIKFLSQYVIIRFSCPYYNEMRYCSGNWVIRLDLNGESSPKNLGAVGGYNLNYNTIVIDNKLYLATEHNIRPEKIDKELKFWNEDFTELKKLMSLEEFIKFEDYTYSFTDFFNYENELVAIRRTNGVNKFFKVLDDGIMDELAELQIGDIQALVINNEKIAFTISDQPFGKAYQVNENKSSEYIFELISYDRNIIVTDELIIYFGFDNEIGIYNQAEQSSKIVNLTTQVAFPEISGVPLQVMNAGEKYEFIPKIYDPLSLSLKLTIENKPSWAEFDVTTGALTGTPIDVAQYDNIIITVSNGYLKTILPAFSIQVLEAESNESPKDSGGSFVYLLFVLANCYLLRVYLAKNTAKFLANKEIN